MSKVSTVLEVQQMEVDTVVPHIKGTLKTLYRPKSGTGERGPWSFQNGVLSDGKNEIKVTFKDREEVPQSMKGKSIYISAHHGDRGWTGVYRKVDEYNGKQSPLLWVTPTAEITPAFTFEQQGGSASAAAAPQDSNPAGEAPQQPAQRTSAPASPNAIAGAKAFIGRKLSAQKITIKATKYLADEWEALFGEPMPLELFQSINATLFIAGDRAGVFDNLPAHITLGDLQPPAKKATAPAPAPQATPPQPAPAPEVPEDDVPY